MNRVKRLAYCTLGVLAFFGGLMIFDYFNQNKGCLGSECRTYHTFTAQAQEVSALVSSKQVSRAIANLRKHHTRYVFEIDSGKIIYQIQDGTSHYRITLQSDPAVIEVDRQESLRRIYIRDYGQDGLIEVIRVSRIDPLGRDNVNLADDPRQWKFDVEAARSMYAELIQDLQ